jgi:vacuolar-type H+-ATPase subunit E/Vma4
MRTWGSAAAVVAALRDDAAAERERLERENEEALASLRAPAAQAADDESDAGLDRVRRSLAEAEAADDWDGTVTAASDRDAWIGEVAERGRRAIAADPAPQPWLERLAREAMGELPGARCVVVVPAAQVAGAEAWRGAMERETGKAITIEGGTFAAGCIARTPDGRVVFDNTVDARERRSRTAWRTAVARVYDAARSATPVPAEVA